MSDSDIAVPAVASPDYDAIVVGAGFGGLCALYKLREAGFSVRVFEAGSGVGGTWFWNRYPGARCDNESLEYSYSFLPEIQREWRWTERYATQPEILSYIEHVAERFDLLRDIQLNTRVVSARHDVNSRLWTVTTDRGEAVTARFCLMTTGNLSVPKVPDWPGMDAFGGDIVHTAAWPAGGVDFAGKRVGVVGTGSSGVQAIPQLVKQAEQVVVFQRTPNYVVPATNWFFDEDHPVPDEAEYNAKRAQARQSPLGFFAATPTRSAMSVSADEREAVYEERWAANGVSFLLSFDDIIVDIDANETAAEFVRGKVRSIIRDPVKARIAEPSGYPIGTKRLCCEIGYFDALNADNLALVDLRETPVVKVDHAGIATAAGHYPLDILVCATGFDAMVGALNRIDIRGAEGQALQAEWADGPRAYLGLMVAGFPNLFTVTGPGSPSVLSNVIVSIEQHVDWITDCLRHMRAAGLTSIEAAPEAEVEWMDHVNDVASQTLFARAQSWYQGVTSDGRRVFMPYVGGVGAYRELCDAVAADNYRGFVFKA